MGAGTILIGRNRAYTNKNYGYRRGPIQKATVSDPPSSSVVQTAGFKRDSAFPI